MNTEDLVLSKANIAQIIHQGIVEEYFISYSNKNIVSKLEFINSNKLLFFKSFFIPTGILGSFSIDALEAYLWPEENEFYKNKSEILKIKNYITRVYDSTALKMQYFFSCENIAQLNDKIRESPYALRWEIIEQYYEFPIEDALYLLYYILHASRKCWLQQETSESSTKAQTSVNETRV